MVYGLLLFTLRISIDLHIGWKFRSVRITLNKQNRIKSGKRVRIDSKTSTNTNTMVIALNLNILEPLDDSVENENKYIMIDSMESICCISLILLSLYNMLYVMMMIHRRDNY